MRHRLFREFLQAQARRHRTPERIGELLAAAARLFTRDRRSDSRGINPAVALLSLLPYVVSAFLLG